MRNVRQLGSRLQAKEPGRRILRLQLIAGRTISNDHLRTGEIQIQKRLDVLFDCDTGHTQKYRPRQVERAAMATRECFDLNAALPTDEACETRSASSFSRLAVATMVAAAALESAAAPDGRRSAAPGDAAAKIFRISGVEQVVNEMPWRRQ